MTGNYTRIDGCREGWLAVTLRSGNTAGFFDARLFAAGGRLEMPTESEYDRFGIPIQAVFWQ